MTNAEYLQTQINLFGIAAAIAVLPLDDFIDRAAQAEAIGPILHPTEYQAAGAHLSAIIELARAARTFQTFVINQRAQHAPAHDRRP